MTDREKLEKIDDLSCLQEASEFAQKWTGCTKVAVGSLIVTKPDGLGISQKVFGANRAIPNLCMGSRGCLRVELYGDDSKNHRGPADCRAIHSEISAIAEAASQGVGVWGSTIYVTRYPCEACARAIVAARIKRVVYGRRQKITQMTREILQSGGVEIVNLPTDEYDVTR